VLNFRTALVLSVLAFPILSKLIHWSPSAAVSVFIVWEVLSSKRVEYHGLFLVRGLPILLPPIPMICLAAIVVSTIPKKLAAIVRSRSKKLAAIVAGHQDWRSGKSLRRGTS